MRNIKIFDTTLRDGEQSPGCSMNKKEKVMIAKKLDEMGVDVIEAGFAASSKMDSEAIKEISKVVKNSVVTSLARCNKSDIDKASDALRYAENKRIHVFIATSDIHMRDKLNKTKNEVRDIVRTMVSYAKSKCSDIEFSLEDATRTDKDFAVEIIDIAIQSGATTINIPDTVGYITPDEFYEFIYYIKKHSKYINGVNMSVHCHNDLGLAVANTVSAIKAGANQVECTINGIGERAGNASLEEIVAILDIKRDYFNANTHIDKKQIFGISKLVQDITGSFVQNNKPIVGVNAFRHEAGIHQAGVLKNKETYEILKASDYGVDVDNIVIGIHSGKNAIVDKMIKMDCNPCEYDISMVVECVKEHFRYNKVISDQEFLNLLAPCKIHIKIKK